MKVYHAPDSSGSLSQQSKYGRRGKSRCKGTVFVQRINSGAQEVDLRRSDGGWLHVDTAAIHPLKYLVELDSRSLSEPIILLLYANYSCLRSHLGDASVKFYVQSHYKPNLRLVTGVKC